MIFESEEQHTKKNGKNMSPEFRKEFVFQIFNHGVQALTLHEYHQQHQKPQ